VKISGLSSSISRYWSWRAVSGVCQSSSEMGGEDEDSDEFDGHHEGGWS
jgi:hypothetical protein